MSIIMVTGGRTYDDWATMRKELSLYNRLGNILIQGGASGADELAYRVWTKDFQLPAVTAPAAWDRMGRPAGAARNHQMIVGNSIAPYALLIPDGVIAFPGGRGTAHAVREAEEHNIQVVRV